MSQQSADKVRSAKQQVELAQDLGLFDASMIGIGATIGAGIFVLTGLACGEAGPAALLAFLFNGGVALLTALSYAELSSTRPEAGGGYSFVRRSMSAPMAFLSGWMLWFAYTVACALYARGFAGYSLEFLLEYWPGAHHFLESAVGHQGAINAITIAVCVTFILVNLAGAAMMGKAENAATMAKIIILALFIGFGIFHMARHSEVAVANFTPFFPKGYLPLLTAMGLVFIAFEGYDLIATASEEIKNPTQNIPKAIFITLAVPVVIYLLVIIVSIGAVTPVGGQPVWQFLGEKKETAIVYAAKAFMPGIGVALIVAGGLFSTVSALNATVLASSRVAFSMGRDGMLPSFFGRVHPTRRVPHIAILVTGAILTGMATLLPLESVGSGASLLFLLSFALANWAAILLRVRDPKASQHGFRVPLFPLTPILGMVSCILLAVYQYKFSPQAWYVSLGWVALGAIVYNLYIRRLDVEEERMIRLEHAVRPASTYRVLVPVANPETMPAMVRIAAALARHRDGEVVVLSVVEVPPTLPLDAGRAFARSQRSSQSAVNQAASLARELGLDCHCVVKASRSVSQGILTTVEKESCDLVVLGWRGWTAQKGRILGHTLDPVVGGAPCDVLVYKPGKDLDEIKSIMVATTASPHSALAVELAPLLASDLDAAVEYVHIIKRGTEMDRETVERYLAHRGPVRAKEDIGHGIELRVEEADSTAPGIITESNKFDMVLVGAAREGVVPQLVFGDKTQTVAKMTKASVLMVKRGRTGPRSWFSRLFLPDVE